VSFPVGTLFERALAAHDGAGSTGDAGDVAVEAVTGRLIGRIQGLGIGLECRCGNMKWDNDDHWNGIHDVYRIVYLFMRFSVLCQCF